MKRIGLCVVLIVLMAIPAGAAEKKPPRVEVVFVLDTTGSMSGLINAAKEKIWSIANTLATTKPAPDIKMGLVGYRDRGDAYVTQVTDLTDDLDAVYTKLMAFKAGGGGDTPESVNQALHEAVTKITWSTDDKTYRVLFLVGDCPPHMDYKDDVKYPVTCEMAAKRAITINTIQCGTHGTTTPIWSEIARKAEGQFFRVEQSGGAILASTPYDKDLAELAKELDKTRVYFGSAQIRAEQKKREGLGKAIYAKGSVEANARRAVFNGSAAGWRNFAGRQELCQALADGRVKLDALKDEELPDELKKMSAKDRKAYVEKQIAERKRVQAKITDLAAKRQKHIEEQIKKTKLDAKKSLDHGIFGAVKEQAGKKGIKYDKVAY